MAKADYKIEDADDLDNTDLDDGEDEPLPRKTKTKDEDTSDVDDGTFDELSRGIKFPDEKPRKVAKVSDDEDLDEDIDEDLDEDQQEADEEDEGDEPEDRRDDESRKSWMARLARERRLRQEAEDDRDASRASLDELRRDVAGIKTQIDASGKTVEIDAKIENLKVKQQNLTALRVAAVEAGETTKAEELLLQLMDISGDIKVAQENRKNILALADAQKRDTGRSQQQPNMHVQRWIRRHPAYNTDAGFKVYCIEVDKKLIAGGSNPADGNHFRKLSREVSKRFPEYFKDDQDAAPVNTKRRRPPVQNDNDTSPTSKVARRTGTLDLTRHGNKITLNAAHQKVMRDFGLDPKNKQDVADYVRNNPQAVR